MFYHFSKKKGFLLKKYNFRDCYSKEMAMFNFFGGILSCTQENLGRSLVDGSHYQAAV